MFTVTVAIPAFNEESNISNILRDLLVQKIKGFAIKKILVVSDGSSDKTVLKVKQAKASIIELVDGKQRRGLAFRQNQIFSLTKTDAVLLIQADTRIKDKNFVQKLISPILEKKADLTSAKLEELEDQSWIAQTLDWSMKLKKNIYQYINRGQNVYTCYGPARAFSKKLYSKMKFKHSVGEDAYSYFFCKKNKMLFLAVDEAKIYYKLPDKFTDHLNQSLRFSSAKDLLENEFGNEMVKREYFLPFSQVINQLLKSILKSPHLFVNYLFITVFVKLVSVIKKESSDLWKIAHTSKLVRGIN